MNNIKANKRKVREILLRLLVVMDQAITDQNISNADIFMLAHNFHCHIVFYQETIAKFDPESAVVFRQAAIDTFIERMRSEPFNEIENEDEQINLEENDNE